MTRPLVLGVLLVLFAGSVASAHDERFSTSIVEIKPTEVLWTVNVGVAGLEKVVRLPAGELELTEAQLQDSKSDIIAYLLGVSRSRSWPVEPKPGERSMPPATGQKYISYARRHLRFPPR